MSTYARLTWDEAENRKYEYGVSQGVLFPMKDDGTYDEGKPWNRGAEEYHNSIEAYTYPDEFAECDGSAQPIPGMYLGQQVRKKFGLSWRTEIGNANTDKLGYKIHVAYGLSASPTEKSHDTVNDSPEANPLSWDVEGTPVPTTGYKSTAKLEFDSTKLNAAQMKALEDLLYGSVAAASKLPSPDEILTALQAAATTADT